MRDVWRKAGLGPPVLVRLSEADAFAGIGLKRREALWEAKALAPGPVLPLFARDIDGEVVDEPTALLPEMTIGEQVVEDYVSTRLTLRAHPVALLRHILTPGAQPVDVTPTTARAPDLSRISFTRGNPD